ncbi:hypothetical protein [Enterococcus gilvus]|uniref:hypothetical protein n=1 Tax=Enterococcus TaxID=1350 RepID=UPI002915642C|nr:hypothetical protein [Enterococcus gilvus]MDU5512077.1 hypothetical protein [Enterococcus gilvus]
MDFEQFIVVFDFLEKVKIRRYVFPAMVLVMTISYLKIRYSRRKITQEEENILIEATYQKDENGLYPWEADTDDHPDRVGKKCKPIQKNWGPQRGRW